MLFSASLQQPFSVAINTAFALLMIVAMRPTVLSSVRAQAEDIPHNEVKNWALKFGVDLWEFGRQITNMHEIQRKYREREAKVKRKDGLILIRDLAAEVKNFMDIKRNSVLRLMEAGEQSALSQQDTSIRSERLLNDEFTDYKSLESVERYEQCAFNTTSNCVLLQSSYLEQEIDDEAVLQGMQWTSNLDPIFVSNYEMDPVLSWQYFGSTKGILRRFPTLRWSTYSGLAPSNMYDYRLNQWFVEAATSAKDIIIIADLSNVLSDYKLSLVRATALAALDTLGANDFVNVLSLEASNYEIVPCFKELIVQANEKNLRDLRWAVAQSKFTGGSNFTGALARAFDILHKFNQTGQGSQCNQAILVITDGPFGPYKEILQHNKPHMPVRVFTYLVGKDNSNAADMNWIACNNKGYFEHIEDQRNLREKVLNYVLVMARPLVMYQNDHPVYWSPVYLTNKVDNLKATDSVDNRLMTTVSAPVYDKRNYSERAANLLGVVGMDVYISDIKKLVPAYKLGANGYSFILDNNGHVLYHPDFRPTQSDSIRPQYKTVDLSEIELPEADNNNNTLLLELRREMVKQEEGESQLKVKNHLDNMRRVTTRKYKYFYHPIKDTPFSLGIALPDSYGMYEVLGEEEIKLTQFNITEFFKGKHWKVHPDWVYCEYNYANEYNFKTPEDRVLHFLSRTKKPGWKWMSLRSRLTQRDTDTNQAYNTWRKEKDSHYCDKNLLQSLVFDALVTDSLEQPTIQISKADKHPIATLMALLHSQGHHMFGVTLTFIATRSGLLRWREHGTDTNEGSEPHFSETNSRAIDEVWYKRAIDQHSVEPESFTFSVPFNSGTGLDRPLITATHAMFVENKGHRAAAAVVGIQFQHSSIASHFINITSTCTGMTGCKKTCASDDLDCYVLDNNGFIIISEQSHHTGQFFGQTDGTIMDSLVQDGIYKKITVVDNQGSCQNGIELGTDSATGLRPFQPITWFIKWFLGRLTWMAIETHLYHVLFPKWIYGQADEPAYADYDIDPIDGSFPEDKLPVDQSEKPILRDENPNAGSNNDYGDLPPHPPLYVPNIKNNDYFNPTHNHTLPGVTRTCKKTVDLYVLQPSRLNMSGSFNPLKGKLTNCHATGCERPFSVQKIPHSNLILLVVDTLCPCGSKQLSIEPQEVRHADESGQPVYYCQEQNIHRRITGKCINYHPEEIEIKQCGSSSALIVTSYLVLLCLITAIWIT
ncbi:voltage-dependent calcium channel subunit alpha-2/delta-3 isoform X2 [Daktulosphaira vitifoliae]|uniref:voltage-dependent calcium channel subunit alpha-2/delta-3 isoform X2 n=1 Tax=Daktulosphaira vitifoliae TaxID=58002 RepID=UPI0021AACCD4|nr:voltage-dependent calcium channel subunit alpha-2/delta-3 isoform X2 [Daktulosphaira vitifoliae]